MQISLLFLIIGILFFIIGYRNNSNGNLNVNNSINQKKEYNILSNIDFLSNQSDNKSTEISQLNNS